MLGFRAYGPSLGCVASFMKQPTYPVVSACRRGIHFIWIRNKFAVGEGGEESSVSNM